MPKYYKFSDLDDLSMQDVVNIRENARHCKGELISKEWVL